MHPPPPGSKSKPAAKREWVQRGELANALTAGSSLCVMYAYSALAVIRVCMRAFMCVCARVCVRVHLCVIIQWMCV
jgi:hypothetical protein